MDWVDRDDPLAACPLSPFAYITPPKIKAAMYFVGSDFESKTPAGGEWIKEVGDVAGR
jgi:hypothetical protein